MTTPEAVRRYYDANTPFFMRWGSSAEARSIHRAVWAEGVRSLDEALHYSNHLLLTEIESLNRAALLVVDLGCGVGGSLHYLAGRLTTPAALFGLTLSPVQAQLARAHSTLSIVEGDFLRVPLAGGADCVYSVEAFIHSPNAEAYFAEAARLLNPGGRLILIDDFRPESAPENHYWLEAYRRGWHAPNLQTVPHVDSLARTRGLRLIANRHLTPHLRLRALPNALAVALQEAGRRLPIHHPLWPSTLGSMALQQALRLGLIEYRCLMWERLPSPF